MTQISSRLAWLSSLSLFVVLSGCVTTVNRYDLYKAHLQTVQRQKEYECRKLTKLEKQQKLISKHSFDSLRLTEQLAQCIQNGALGQPQRPQETISLP